MGRRYRWCYPRATVQVSPLPAAVGPVGTTDHIVIWLAVSYPANGSGLTGITTDPGIVLGQLATST